MWSNSSEADAAVRNIVALANSYLLAQNALLQMEIARITWRNDPKHFNVGGLEGWALPSDWKRAGEIDMIVINSFAKESKAGR